MNESYYIILVLSRLCGKNCSQLALQDGEKGRRNDSDDEQGTTVGSGV